MAFQDAVARVLLNLVNGDRIVMGNELTARFTGGHFLLEVKYPFDIVRLSPSFDEVF